MGQGNQKGIFHYLAHDNGYSENFCYSGCIGCMKIFEHIYIITSGGPGTASMVGAMYAYKTSFIKQRFGYGSTISVGIMAVSLTLVLICNVIFGKGKKKYE